MVKSGAMSPPLGPPNVAFLIGTDEAGSAGACAKRADDVSETIRPKKRRGLRGLKSFMGTTGPPVWLLDLQYTLDRPQSALGLSLGTPARRGIQRASPMPDFSLSSSSFLRSTRQRYPPSPPLLRTTLWQGMRTAILLAPQAVPTARTALGEPISAANSPYVRVSPRGIRCSAFHTPC